MLSPSRSRLFLGLKAFIKSVTCTGPVFPRTRLGVLGFVIIKSARFFVMGVTESEISLPIFAKNVLKCSAISCLFSTIFPLICSFLREWVVFLPVETSLMNSHILQGFLQLFLSCSLKYSFLLALRTLLKIFLYLL